MRAGYRQLLIQEGIDDASTVVFSTYSYGFVTGLRIVQVTARIRSHQGDKKQVRIPRLQRDWPSSSHKISEDIVAHPEKLVHHEPQYQLLSATAIHTVQ